MLRLSAQRSNTSSTDGENRSRAMLLPAREGEDEKPTCEAPTIVIDTTGEDSKPTIPDVAITIVDDNAAETATPETGVPVVLDLGFAQVELRTAETWPKYDFYIIAKDGILTQEGAVALLNYLDFVLNMPDVVSSGFVLTYDLCSCSVPQMDLVHWIMHFISDPQREEAWHERLICWKVVAPPGVYFRVVQSALSFLFKVCPPRCRVFLVRDVDVNTMKNWICYRPDDDSIATMFSNIGAGFVDSFFPEFFSPQVQARPVAEHQVPATSPESATTSYDAAAKEPQPSQKRSGSRPLQSSRRAPINPAPASAEGTTKFRRPHTPPRQRAKPETQVKEPLTASVPKLPGCAASLTTSFAIISQGFNRETQQGYLKIMGLDAPMTEDGIEAIMGFMDDFINCPNAQQGYSITYDLRKLSIPSMNMVMRVADWGKEPKRQAKWTKLNTSCKIVVNSGFRFSICKGVIKSFFYMCPPVCRTFLLTDPDESEATAVTFEPKAGSQTQIEEDAQSEQAEVLSDDGLGSCGEGAGASDSTSTSARSNTSNDGDGEQRSEQEKVVFSGDIGAFSEMFALKLKSFREAKRNKEASMPLFEPAPPHII